MTESVDMVEIDGETLEDLEQEWQAEQAEQEQADPAEAARARELAEKMNAGFLWVVNRTQCPHVNIDEIVNREAGADAFEPLAEKWGGEVPAWVQQFSPYISAGVYMATTIATARQIERQVMEEHERKQKQEQGGNGNESADRATE